MVTDNSSEVYKPSWFDRFNDWLEQLRIRPWLVYVLLGVALVLAQVVLLWLEGGSLADELLPVICFNGLAVPYLLALIRLLDDQAVQAMQGMRPVLRVSDEVFDTYKFRIATMPFLAPLLAGLAMMVFAVLFPFVATEPGRYAALAQLPLFNVAFQIIDKSSAFLFGVVVYHTIRQLRLVNAITSNHIRVNIFQLRPVQAFSRLTAATAVGLLIFFYGWFFINPDLLADPAILGVSLLFTTLAVLVFAWPLWGVHRMMVAEKERALQQIERQFEDIFALFNRHLHADDYPAAQKLNGAIMSLEVQHNRVSAVPTWPWRSETARIVLSAVALPILLMIMQLLVQRALGS